MTAAAILASLTAGTASSAPVPSYLQDASDVPPIASLGNVAALGVVALRERGLMRPAPLDWPTSGRFESYFGPRWGRQHNGIDVSNERGTAVRVAASGVVRFAGVDPPYAGYGTMVIVDHGTGVSTRYAHLSATRARAGMRVTRGERIGAMGATGRVTGTHLHFEVLRDGVAVNPLRFLGAPPASISGDVEMP